MSHKISDIASQIKIIKDKCHHIRPLVAVRCITFNQAPYIREALDGFLMQKTNFPFVVVVHDDASTDGTTQILLEYSEKYPDLIFPLIQKENQYSKGGAGFRLIIHEAIIATGAEYMAFCEADDYWTDPFKLQKQVDLMTQFPEIGLCYTGFDIKDEIRNTYRKNLFETEPEIFPKEYKQPFDFILKKGYVAPPSWLVRVSKWKKELPASVDGTFVRFLDFLVNDEVKLLPDVTCVYRIHDNSASNSTDYEKVYTRQNKLLQTQLNLIDYYNLPEVYKEKILEAHHKQYLKSHVINCKHQDVAKAKEIIVDKTLSENIWFLLEALKLSYILRHFKKLKYSFLSKKAL